MKRKITGIILCGGKSTRMKSNKAFLKLGDKLMIEHVADAMSSVFPEILLVTNSPEDYEFLGLKMFKDIFPIGGPLAGIHSGLKNSRTEKNFIISCDMPLMPNHIIEQIINVASDKEIILCRVNGFLQSLVGVYSKSSISHITEIFKSIQSTNYELNIKHHAKVRTLLDKVEYEVIDEESLVGYKSEYFYNINTDEEYLMVKSLL